MTCKISLYCSIGRKVENNLSGVKNQSNAQVHPVCTNDEQNETAGLSLLSSAQNLRSSQKPNTKQNAIAKVNPSGTNSGRHKSRSSSDRRSKMSLVAESSGVRLIANPCNFESIHYKTSKHFWGDIRKQGIRCDSKGCIQFTVSPGIGYTASDTAVPDAFIYIDVRKAVKDGLEFYVSSRNVVSSVGLDGIIASKYFKFVLIYDYKTKKFEDVNI